jgi:hypothetical protein
MSSTVQRETAISPSPPSVPRLRLEPILSRPTLLDGGWWPRSKDPVAELPGLILVLQRSRGPITRVMIGPLGWDSRPHRLSVAGRVVRLGWFTSLPAGLLTAICSDRSRVDLLVVPPDTSPASADAAMAFAAEAGNTVHAPDILAHLTSHPTPNTEPDLTEPEAAWENEGGAPRDRTPAT